MLANRSTKEQRGVWGGRKSFWFSPARIPQHQPLRQQALRRQQPLHQKRPSGGGHLQPPQQQLLPPRSQRTAPCSKIRSSLSEKIEPSQATARLLLRTYEIRFELRFDMSFQFL